MTLCISNVVLANQFNPNIRVSKIGDEQIWASPNFDDSNWEDQYITENTIFWVRFEINFPASIEAIRHKGIQMISLGSYEAYWDGHLVFENGKVGNSIDKEIPGQFLSQFIILDSLCQIGKHVLALRVSNYHHTTFHGSWNIFFVEEYLASNRSSLKLTALMFILGGAFLIAGIYYLFLYFSERKKWTTLIFSILCFCFFTLIILEFLKFYYAYPYHFHYFRLLGIGMVTVLITILLPIFLFLEFNIPRWKYVALGYLVLVTVFILFYGILNDYPLQRLSIIMLLMSIVISGYAIYLKRKGAWVVLSALLTIGLINIFSTYNFKQFLFNYDINLFVSFTILIVSFLYLMAQKRKEEQLAYESTLLLSSRLKVELLKKNIQPHFIMNTLTSIMEWVETSPKKSIQFIEALAKEFEILNEIADLQLIPIQQEIDLCKRHLEIMTFRKEVKYIWNESGIDPTELIPPAILHTIIENGITHSKAIDGQVIFNLKYEALNGIKIYELKTIAENRTSTKKSGGTGFKYIESRLTESYGNRWELKSGASSNGWTTSIILLDHHK